MGAMASNAMHTQAHIYARFTPTRAMRMPPGIPMAAPTSMGRDTSRPASQWLIPYSSMARGSSGERAKRFSPAARWAASVIPAIKRRARLVTGADASAAN